MSREHAIDPKRALAVIEEQVLGSREAFEAALVDPTISFAREAGFAVQALMAQPYTMEIALQNQQSVRNAVTNIAAMALTLNPARKQAYLVPRDGRICLDISYMGLVDVAVQSGSVRWAQAELVYAADVFKLAGIDRAPIHERDPFAKDRGELVGVYVVAKTVDGDYLTTTMPIDEVYRIRKRSSAFKNGKGPWVSDHDEMVKKTVIKRAYKLWPKTERLDAAIHHLNNEAGEGIEMEREDDAPTGVVVAMPQRKSAATTIDNETGEIVPPAAAQAPQTETQPGISPGHVKNLENMVRAIPLEGDALAQFLARHDAKAIDTSLTMAQFSAMKAELRKF